MTTGNMEQIETAAPTRSVECSAGLGVMTINDHLNKPSPLPLKIACDLVDRLAPLDLQESGMWFVNLVDDLTVGELRQIVEDCQVASKKAAKRKLYRWKYT